MTVLITGAGIGGLSLALTCHQIGAPFKLFESVPELRPLGVGINLQPNAVRELYDLGLESALAKIGIATRELGFFSKKGLEIWTEPRGKLAGYDWPQYSVHRGQLQMMLYNALVERAGADCIETGWRITGFTNSKDGASVQMCGADGEVREVHGQVVIGADGIHSAIRAQMRPGEEPPIWGGAILWRGTTQAPAYRTNASMVMIGHDTQRVVAYPITLPNADTGLATINWIAELRFDPGAGWNKEDWNREANTADFAPAFEEWRYGWIDTPSLISGAQRVYEYPMVDRDPIDSWTQGNVTLMGDAAHATYPVGSSGASQAIVDARRLGREFIDQGVGPDALQAYEATVLPLANKVISTNRGSGPDAVLQVVEDRCGGVFTNIDDVIPHDEMKAHAAKYKTIAGFAVEALNQAPSTIAEGERLRTV
jgi:5-methylphenazine-1-carboxylate 1-monooxygenase